MAEETKATVEHESPGRIRFVSELHSRKISIGQYSKESGLAKGFVSEVASGKRPSTERFRAESERILGIPASEWITGSAVFSGEQNAPVSADNAAPAEQTAIELARDSLRSIDNQLRTQTSPADAARLLGLRNQVIKTIGSLTGELDQTELQKFRLSPEFRSTVRRIVSAVQGCPVCSANIEAVLGGDVSLAAAKIDCQVALVPEELVIFCDRVENHVTVDDLASATDVLHYRTHQRERELVELDLRLAKRVHAALKIAQPVIQSSRIAYPPADSHRQTVIDRLGVEIARGDRVEAFRADFGQLATQRALAL